MILDPNQPIGVFDSGLGGISVLREIVSLMPAEDYIYYGDSANAPYGIRPTEEILQLSDAVMDELMEHEVKAVVIACNTASSVAGEYLRHKYPELPIVAIEPALKPAVENTEDGTILVLATDATLREAKYHALLKRYEADYDIINFACPEIVEAVEEGDIKSDNLRAKLEARFAKVADKNIRSIVLGCTHYPFVRNMIQEIAGSDVKIFDGASGTARQLYRRLDELNLLRDDDVPGSIVWKNSSEDKGLIKLSQKLMTLRG